eukprot:GHUV01046376.1.p1 GENE.GHUV01046376.1~~GHUV01046376.1.p1  ORF type:complete len:114 (+),score=6.22 GHUV01046376.1:117-458(+)
MEWVTCCAAIILTTRVDKQKCVAIYSGTNTAAIAEVTQTFEGQTELWRRRARNIFQKLNALACLFLCYRINNSSIPCDLSTAEQNLSTDLPSAWYQPHMSASAHRCKHQCTGQ